MAIPLCGIAGARTSRPATADAVAWRWSKQPPDYAQSSACAPGSMETRAQALRKLVIPAKAGIHFDSRPLDSRFLPAFARMTGNDGIESAGRTVSRCASVPAGSCEGGRLAHLRHSRGSGNPGVRERCVLGVRASAGEMPGPLCHVAGLRPACGRDARAPRFTAGVWFRLCRPGSEIRVSIRPKHPPTMRAMSADDHESTRTRTHIEIHIGGDGHGFQNDDRS